MPAAWTTARVLLFSLADIPAVAFGPVRIPPAPVILSLLLILAGLVGLVWGAERFIAGAAAAARAAGVSPLVAGLTVVGMGTSAPEILVSATAAAAGNPGVAVGNAVGSNIANIALVVGATAVLAPITVRSATVRREMPLMFAVIAFAGMLLADGRLGRGDGVALCAGMVVVLLVMARIARMPHPGDPLPEGYRRAVAGAPSPRRVAFWIMVGLVVLLVSARAVVEGAVIVARGLGVSDLVIGLSVVAVGTSLPELAASVASIAKREPDIAIGNVIGSNMFNLLPVLGVAGLIAPVSLDAGFLYRDFPVMLGLSVALVVMATGRGGHGTVNRVEGVVLLAAFSGYQWYLFQAGASA